MGIQAPAEVKFSIIYDAIKDNSMLSISYMCQFAGVSRSGFYAWMRTASARQKREEQDAIDFAIILEAYHFRGYEKGARSIYMRLLHQGIIMNIKKIRRLMNKFHLVCPIRKANPYRRMAKALATSIVAPNVVNREFRRKPRSVLLTDITYLFFKEDGKCYLSVIIDAYTHELLAYRMSQNLKVDFVLETIDDLVTKHGYEIDNETIVHSDQGCHYTSYAFIQKLKDNEFVQSMSRRGNCWDNAPQESFFGHMKDEIRDRVAGCTTYVEVCAVVDDWLDYYNNDRYQWDLMKLSPVEYYQYLQTGVYPLPAYNKNEAELHWGAAPDPGGLSLLFPRGSELSS